MTQTAIESAAAHLWQNWQQGRSIDHLSADCRPCDPAQGYAVQAALVALSGQAVAGWKIAATSIAGQTHIGVGGPLAGRLLAERFSHHPATVAMGAGNIMRVAEAEFAFRMGRDLPPRERPYSQDEVMASVAALHPAVELPNSRFADFVHAGEAQLIADNACAHWFVLGDQVKSDWRGVDLAAHPVVLYRNDEVATQGQGRDALGDPRIALTWIANNHALQGEGLREGQVVTTGVCGKPVPIDAGDKLRADFGEFGVVDVTMV